MNVLTARRQALIVFSFFTAFLQGYYRSVYQFCLVYMIAQFGLGTTELGVLTAMNFISMIAFPIIFGILSEKIGKKKVVLIAAAIAAAGLVMYQFASGYVLLLITILIVGTGMGVVESLYLTMIADTFPEKVGHYSSFTQAVFGVGAFLGPFVGLAMVNGGADWRQVFLHIMILMLANIALLCFAQPKKFEIKKAAGGKKGISLFKSPLFYTIIITMTLFMGVETPLSSFTSNYFVSVMDAPEYAAIALSVFWMLFIPSNIIAGLIKKKRIRIIIICAIALVGSCTMIALAQTAEFAFAGFIISGFFAGSVWAVIFACGQRAFPNATGRMGSFCLAFGGVGGSVFPMIMGAASEGASLSRAYAITAVLAGLTAIFALIMNRQFKKNGIAD